MGSGHIIWSRGIGDSDFSISYGVAFLVQCLADAGMGTRTHIFSFSLSSPQGKGVSDRFENLRENRERSCRAFYIAVEL